MKKRFLLLIPFFMLAACNKTPDISSEESTDSYRYSGESLKVGIIGLSHDHVHWALGRPDHGDMDIVGIVEPDKELVNRFIRQYELSPELIFNTIDEMVSTTGPEAVLAYNAIYDHLSVVEYCAPKGIHVMVEKPLAVNVEHARKMITLAQKNNIHLLTNFETSWYGSTHEAYQIAVDEERIGALRKIVFRTGHQGPAEIGCSSEFLEWLTDSTLNGAGALTDFGCYGANIATWLMKTENPVSISCITQQIKPDIYPQVDDDATIIISYPTTQVIIQASWNWPYNRKDMDIYGVSGHVQCQNATDMLVVEKGESTPKERTAASLPKGLHDSFAYLTTVIKTNHPVKAYALASTENNERVVKILEAAKLSAATGKSVQWSELYPE